MPDRNPSDQDPPDRDPTDRNPLDRNLSDQGPLDRDPTDQNLPDRSAPDRNEPVLDFLLSRRSRPAKLLGPPAPDREALRELLRAAARVPDHGKLEPWRFVVLERPALARIADAVEPAGRRLGRDEEDIAKQRDQYANSPLAVVVVSAPQPSEKIPQVEQVLSAGASCLSLLNAALAAGWGASWLTGWACHDAAFARESFGLQDGETVAGVIHVGTARAAPPERPRPDLDRITRWIET
jgi:nitroreductase